MSTAPEGLGPHGEPVVLMESLKGWPLKVPYLLSSAGCGGRGHFHDLGSHEESNRLSHRRLLGKEIFLSYRM